MLWADYTSKHQALKIHLCFELNRMILVKFIIGSGNSCERLALKQMLEESVTFIADRGYMCFQLFNDIQKSSSFFVFRVKNNLAYQVIESCKLELPKTVQHLFLNVSESISVL